MPAFTNIDRSHSGALIPEDAAASILANLPAASVALSTFRRVTMSRAQYRMPVLSALPTAYWVSPTDTGRKGTTAVEWENVYLNAEELAVIVPIPEALLDDSAFDIWGEIRPLIVEAIGQKVDLATLFGDGAPTSWPDSVYEVAHNAGNIVVSGTAENLWQDIYGVDGVMSQVEEDGYEPNFAAARLGFRAQLRGEADTLGRPIWSAVPSATGPSSILSDGTAIFWSRNGGWNDNDADMIVGDSSKAIIGVRQDITYKLLDQAVLQNDDNSIAVNLAQQDMVALRVVMRVGFATANPPTRANEDAETRAPFAALGKTSS